MDICEAWNRLRMIQKLEFMTQSLLGSNSGWSGSGRGSVRVEEIDAGTILFRENGSWASEQGREFAFNNVFRWTLDSEGPYIRLEHLRFGPKKPVYLFDLVSVSESILESTEPHVCRDDLYSARMEYAILAIHLRWTVIGPKTNERIRYTYL